MLRRLSHLAIICLSCLCIAGCAAPKKQSAAPPPPDDADLGCSYFYFLWGSHAELTDQYAEAIEAFEKALICDPSAEYIQEKIPVLLLKMGELDKAADWLRKAIADHPERDSYRLFLASLSIQQDKVDEAISIYNDILKNDPANEAVLLRLGLLYGQQEKYDKAEQYFRQMLQHNKDSYFAHLSLARLLRQIRKYGEAGTEYEKALKLNWSKELAFEIGYFYAGRKQFTEALRIYTTITNNDQLDERAALSRVQALLDLGQTENALAELKNIRNFTRNPAQIDLIYAKILLRMNDIPHAKKLLEALSANTKLSEVRYLLALLVFQEGDKEKALQYLSEIEPGSEDFEDAVYMRVRILQQEDNDREAIALLKKNIAKEESRSPLFYALLSSLYQRQGDRLQAIALLEAAISIYPENTQLLYEYGIALDRNGLFSKAIITMEKVLELEPEHPDALNYIGYTWADQNINLDKALEYIRKADEQKPDNGYIVDSLGWVYYRLGQFDRAVEELQRALTLEANDPHIYEHLGDVYLAQRDWEKAREMYSTAESMFKTPDNLDQIRQKLDALPE